MKISYLSLALFIYLTLNFSNALAQQNYTLEDSYQVYKWSYVGDAQGIAYSEDPSIALNPQTGAPWIIFKDNSRKLQVQKFDGTNWISVGNLTDIVGSSGDDNDNVRPQILFHPDTHEPFVAFQVTDGDSDATVRVKKFSSGSWISVGSDISQVNKNICSPEIKIAPNSGQLYLTVTGNGNNCSYYDGDEERDARIYKFDGSNWNLIDMSAISASVTKARALSFEIDTNDNLYLAVVDKAKHPNEVSVWKNNGTSWAQIANSSNLVVNGNANDVSLEIDSTNVPWVAVKSKESGYDFLSVYKFDGLNMVQIGNHAFEEQNGVSLKNKSRISFALDNSNVPYVSYAQKVNWPSATFFATKSFKDNEWQDLGISRLYNQSFNTNSHIAHGDNVLWATFKNEDGKISVVKYFQETLETGSWWQPKGFEHLSWQWQLTTPVDTSLNVDMYDVDLFDTSETTIRTLKNSGKKVICYISAGSIEYGSARPDQQDLEDITPSVIGHTMENWSSEKWLNINNSQVREVMARRMDLALNKGCDGIEPDNINAWEVDATNDGYKTGFNITEQQQIDYNTWLADQAHARGLSIGLKNDIGLDSQSSSHLLKLVDYFDWALNEQCYEYNECDIYRVFDNADKAVFGVEYNMEPNQFCEDANTHGRYWMQKNLNLDQWRFACQQTSDKILKTAIYRLYNTRTGVHLYTRGANDRNKILGKYSDFEFTDGAPAFYASLSDDGTTPIYRLYNRRTGVHLYTRGANDRNKILGKYRDFEFTDGEPVFYASLTDDGTTPIYRLYNKRTGVQLYTRGVVDRDKILAKWSDFEFTDGAPAFYLQT